MWGNWSKMGNWSFFRWEHNYTSAPIAHLAARSTFFIWFWPDQTRPDQRGWGFNSPLRNMIFFSSFKLIFSSILCMHLYHILINWSQKFWVVHVQYRFIYEQCAMSLHQLHWLTQFSILVEKLLHKAIINEVLNTYANLIIGNF